MLSAIIPAAGAGVRFGGEKTFAPISGRPVLYWTLLRLSRLEEVEEVVLVVPPGRLESIRAEHGERVAAWGVAAIVGGGETRQESVRRGLDALSARADLVLVHDAVRPLFSLDAARLAIGEARREGAAILAVPARDTLKRAGGEGDEPVVAETVPRGRIWHAETPQVIRRDLLARAYRLADEDGFRATDEASLVEHAGGIVVLVRGGPWNIKVTEMEDLRIVAALLEKDDG